MEPLTTGAYDLALFPLLALVGGGLIGLERSYRGRAAGLRTYALVSFGSALLVVVGARWASLLSDAAAVTRVIQGIVTGIGFLGAGVIVKEGFTVRGLTTAASIWVASAIGVAFGAGYLPAAAIAVVLTLVALSLLRMVEDRLYVQRYVHCRIAFHRTRLQDEPWLRAFVSRHAFTITELGMRLDGRSDLVEYRMTMWSADAAAAAALGRALIDQEAVAEFAISPSRD